MRFFIYIFLFLFLGCKLPKENNIKENNIVQSPIKDTVKNNDYLVNDYVNHKIIVTSNDMMVGMGKPSDSDVKGSLSRIKIIEIKNTKVIKQSTDYSDGRIIYKIPDKMKIRTTYKVLVRISKSKSVVSIYDSLQGIVMSSDIPVTETMEVKLIDISPNDNRAFEMVADNNGVQLIEDGDTYTEWSWNVTPIRIGNSKLKIVVSVIRGDNKKDIVYEDSVEVEKDIITQVLFFFKKYWQYILSTIAFPLIVWLYKNRKENKKTEIK